MEFLKKAWNIICKCSVFVMNWLKGLVSTSLDTAIFTTLLFLSGTFVFNGDIIDIIGYGIILLFLVITFCNKK